MTALLIGLVALVVGMFAGYMLGKPKPTASQSGILGQIGGVLGIKL
jgi:hypothetical protein